MKQKRAGSNKFSHKHVLKNEINTYRKNMKNVNLRIGLVFPNKYRIGMANLALKILYSLWNSQDHVFVERFFQPETLSEEPKSIETGSSLRNFDVIAVTIQFELDYVNFIRMLLQGGIPVYRNDRNIENDPIIIAGGPAVTTNPLPLSDFLDIVIQGEVEPLTDDLLIALYERNLHLLKNIKGIYFPDNPPEKAYYSRIIDYDLSFIPTAQVRNVNDANWRESQVLGGYLLQPCRGCNRGCKFCLIGRLTRPLRERSLKTLERATLEGAELTRTKHLTLIGSGVGDYSKLTEYLHFLNENNLTFSIPSIRADSDPSILNEIVKSKQRTITIAPEVGSDMYRFQVGKRIDNETFFSFVDQANTAGISNLKMYFILGLPDQNMAEIDHIISFCKKIAQNYRKRSLNLTFGPFVPKKQTKFDQYQISEAWVENTKLMEKKIKKGLRDYGGLHMGSIKWSIIQTILSNGDTRLSKVLEGVAHTQGQHRDWIEVLGKNPVFYLEEMQKKEDLDIPLEIVG